MMIEEKLYRENLRANIFNIFALEYIKTKNADPKKAYALGLLSSIGSSISSITLLYNEENKFDEVDIIQFHKAYLDIGLFKYKGNDIFFMIEEISKTKEMLIEDKVKENSKNLFSITYN
jgi:hypothetical protein